MATERLTTPADRAWNDPHPSRLPLAHPTYAEILRRHAAAVAVGDAGYLDPVTGLFVMTSATHLNRGFCCERGCRHCPFVQ